MRPARRSCRASCGGANAARPRLSMRSPARRRTLVRGQETKERNYHGCEYDAESKHPPVGRQNQPRGIVPRIDHAHHQGRGPPAKSAPPAAAKRASRVLSTNTSLHQPPPPGADRDAERHLAPPRRCLAAIRLATLAHAISRTIRTRPRWHPAPGHIHSASQRRRSERVSAGPHSSGHFAVSL